MYYSHVAGGRLWHGDMVYYSICFDDRHAMGNTVHSQALPRP